MTTSTDTTKVYEEIVDFIASGTTPQSTIDFKLSENTQERLEDLVYLQKQGKLSSDEQQELDNFLVIEHIMRLAKARAYKYL
jgi:hypothetical protein